MEFKGPYLYAMRERAPKMFNRLRRTGALNKHLQDKSREAHQMFRMLTEGAPTLPNGYPRDPEAREAEQQVLETLIEFPSETPANVDGDPLVTPAPNR